MRVKSDVPSGVMGVADHQLDPAQAPPGELAQALGLRFKEVSGP
jgi:hypothetical protein